MFANRVLIALSLPFIFSLTACGDDVGGAGDADQNVVRNLFAVGDVLETKEDSPGVTGNVCENDLPDTCDLPDGSQNKLSFALEKVRPWIMDHFLFVRMALISIRLASLLLVLNL